MKIGLARRRRNEHATANETFVKFGSTRVERLLATYAGLMIGAVGDHVKQGIGYRSRQRPPRLAIVVAGLVVLDSLQELVALVVLVGLSAEVFEQQLADRLDLDHIAVAETDQRCSAGLR